MSKDKICAVLCEKLTTYNNNNNKQAAVAEIVLYTKVSAMYPCEIVPVFYSGELFGHTSTAAS